MCNAAGAAQRIARAIMALEQKRLNSHTKRYVIIELKEVLEYLEGLS